MTAGRRNWGPTAWTRQENKPQSPRRDTPLVAIIGGGLTGASTAYHLGRRGISAAIYEASIIGDGASGRTGGLVLEGTAAGPLEQVDNCIVELQVLVAAEQIDCGLALPGCWEIEHGESPRQPTLPWSDCGQPVHVARTVRGGVVDPMRLLGGILEAAARHGAAIIENQPALRLIPGTRPAVEFASSTVRPEYVVIAVNAWLAGLLPKAEVNARSCLTFACATRPMDQATLYGIGLAAGIPFYTADLPYLWGRITGDRRVIFGSGLVFGSPRQLEHSDVNTGSSRAALAQLEERVRGLHPLLKNVEFSASWGGPIAFAPDYVPYLGRLPHSPHVIVAGAYSGHGVALSVRTGQLIARAIDEGAELPEWGALDRARKD